MRTLIRKMSVAVVAALALTLTAGTGTVQNAQALGDNVKSHEPYNADTNPEFYGDLADPDIYYEDGIYYAFGTSALGSIVPVIMSTDLKNWRDVPGLKPPVNPIDGKLAPKQERANRDGWGPYIADHYTDALIRPPMWTSEQVAEGAGIWAPTVAKLKSGNYLMVYAAREIEPGPGLPYGRYCLSYAVATPDLAKGTGRPFGPWGPYADRTTKPLHCSDDPAGTLDPDLFRDPKTDELYLLYKHEGNSAKGYPGGATTIWTQKLQEFSDTIAFAGAPIKLHYTEMDPAPDGRGRPIETWEGTVNENPSMVFHNGKYYMFYSANEFRKDRYATGYTICDSVTGPCHRMAHRPLLKSDPQFKQWGPGGASAFVDQNKQLRLIYHAYGRPETLHSGDPESDPRYFHIATLDTLDALGRVGITQRTHRIPGTNSFDVPVDSFSDVPPGTQHRDHMLWMKRAGISTGWITKDGAEYRPLLPVDREAMAAFIYRAAGSPSYTPPRDLNKCFRDIRGRQFAKEMCWMKESGISKGWPDGTYRPSDRITREAMAAFMYRLAKEPGVDMSQRPFSDIDNKMFEKQMIWMAQAGISTGYGDHTYRPDWPVNRDAMAAFLHRLMEKQTVLYNGVHRVR